MTMRLGLLEHPWGTRETSTGSDGVTKQNIANDNKKTIREIVDSIKLNLCVCFQGRGGPRVPEPIIKICLPICIYIYKDDALLSCMF